jgi:CRISPR type I-E-associated protein CasA/Cse1
MNHTFSFNLVDEPWIPVRLINEAEGQRELSLLEVFQRCHEIRRIEYDRPLVIASLYKLLFAIHQRSIRPSQNHSERAKRIVQGMAEGLDIEAIEQYLAQYRERFDLFHPLTPAFQVPGIFEPKWKDPWYKLTAEDGSWNTSALSNPHKRSLPDAVAVPISPAAAARMLIAHQQYALGGTIKRIITSSQAAINASSAFFIVEGERLLDTLLLNSFPQASDEYEADKALWELPPYRRPEIEAQNIKSPRGVVNTWTWLSRAVLFIPEEVNGSTRVRYMFYAPGLPYNTDVVIDDPCTAYRKLKDGSYMPLRLQKDKAIWRNCNTFLPNSVDGSKAPYVVKQLFRLYQAPYLPGGTHLALRWAIRVIGQSKPPKESKVDLVVDEAYAVGDRMQETEGQSAKNLFETIDHVGGALHQALLSFGSKVLASDTMKADPERVRQFAESTGALTRYWWEMNDVFKTFIAGAGTDDELLHCQRVVIETARSILRQTIEAQGSNRRMLTGIGSAEATFNKLIKQITADLVHQSPEVFQ